MTDNATLWKAMDRRYQRLWSILTAIGVTISAGPGGNVEGVPPEFHGSAHPVRQVPADIKNRRSDRSSRQDHVTALPPSGDASGAGADDCHQAAVVTLPVGPPGSPVTVTLSGETSAATEPDCNARVGAAWWEAFHIDRCATVTIDLCGTDPIPVGAHTFLATFCAPDGSSCGLFWDATDTSRQMCAGEPTIWMRFESLPAGTYFYPIKTNPDSTGTEPYRIHISAEECQGACGGCLGACCLPEDRSCTDDVQQLDCSGPDQEWVARSTCSVIECHPPGSEYDALRVTLLSRIPVSEFPGESGSANDVWGYVSPTGREYAIVGLTRGTGFVDVTDPETPEILAEIPDEHSTWSDVAVYRQYAYNVNEAGGGMQIIDLSEIDQGIVTLVDSFTQNGLQTAHNVFVNTTSGFAYLCGANSPTSGLVAVDVRQPDSPFIAGVWEEAYAHDVYVDSYEGCPYAGRTGPCEIAFVFAGGQGVKIVDATVKTDMVTISTVTYPNLGYCHQGWLGKDRRYLFFDDESDERVFDLTTTTHVVDVRDVGDPQYLFAFTNGRGSIDHNLMVRGRFVFEANYTSGLRVYDVGDLDNVREVAFFDTHPGDNQPDFRGAWGVFAGFPSGLVAVSDMQRGLFVLAPCLPHNTLPNDLDGNGRVDLRDFRHLQRCFGPAPLDSGCQAVDTDCDGDVDLDDFSEFLDSLGPVPLLWSSATRP